MASALAGPAHFDFPNRTLAVPLHPGADDALVYPQWSTDLLDWSADRFEYLGGEPPHWRIQEPPSGGSRLFLRFEVQRR